MQKKLWLTRLKSFSVSAVTLIATGILGVIFSDQFVELLKEYTGASAWGSLIVLFVPEIAKHIRNEIVIGRAYKLGAGARGEVPDIDLI